ncbi:Lsr2 dimerization domain-containing protein [Micropruina sonneratiae]|uniref:Lsr2 dimerization domain-containing protein n=1 Tax=Micropruina sonneratiae TaxID=2986940 RepID=UPI0029D41CAA|nr:histone-like nucleoid-structuring protein Lsr2 [Micropruina sp. KQZ13P-5]
MPGRYTEDDLDGGSADVQVTFALEGQQYEIDLNHRNADALRLALEPLHPGGTKGQRP